MRSLIGNKASEKNIRDWLSENGFLGGSAKFTEIELHAIKRPGWLQIFRFEFSGLTNDSERVKLYGAMRSDERYGKPAIVVFDDLADRGAQLDFWSDGLITQPGRR